jgi:hypothetical protein
MKKRFNYTKGHRAIPTTVGPLPARFARRERQRPRCGSRRPRGVRIPSCASYTGALARDLEGGRSRTSCIRASALRLRPPAAERTINLLHERSVPTPDLHGHIVRNRQLLGRTCDRCCDSSAGFHLAPNVGGDLSVPNMVGVSAPGAGIQIQFCVAAMPQRDQTSSPSAHALHYPGEPACVAISGRSRFGPLAPWRFLC